MKPILLRILILFLFLGGVLISFETITPTEYQNAKNIVIATDIDGNVYTAFQETNNSLNRGKLMEYNGFSWRSIETGIYNSADSDENFSLPSYYFTNSELLYSEIEFDSNNNLYLLYIDHETGFDPIIGVEKFDENRTLVNYDGLLGAVGLNGDFEPEGFYASLDINSSDNPVIAFVDMSSKVSLKYLDLSDNSWKYLENSQDIYTSDEVALAIDNDIPYIAYIDSVSGKISVSKYVDTEWVNVDANISEGDASNIDIYVDNDKNLYIQYNDLGDNNNSINAQLLRYDSFRFIEHKTDLTVGTININSTDSYTFSLSGDDSSLFEINSSGTIKFKNSPNFEDILDSNSDNIYILLVLATNENNISVEREVRVTVADINDNPILETISSISIPENNSTYNFDINGSDEDNDTLIFSISGSDYGVFSINSSSGVLSLISPLNFEEKDSYDLNITLSDGTVDINSSLSIAVQDINEFHTVTSDSNRSALEDINYSLELNITDVDFNSTFTVTDPTGSLPSWLTLQQSENYVVSTLAGNGSSGYTDGVGTDAQFKKPKWLTVDQNGNIFVSDYDDYRIRKITPDGIVSTLAGNGSSGYTDGVGTDAQFNRPTGLAFDSNGNLFVSDVFNRRIRKITPDGNVSTFVGSGSMGYTDGVGLNSDFTSPMGLAFDTNDILFVVDGNKIRKITPDGNVSTFAGSSSSGYTDGVGTDARFNEPQDLVFDTNGNLFVADYYNQRIRKITPDGNVSTFVGSDNGTDMDGYLDGNSTSALFNHLSGLAIDKQNNIFVADLTNNRIRKVTPDGNVSTFAGSDSGYTNGSLSLSRFETPTDLVFDSEGSLFIADLNNAVVRKISLETDETDNILTGTPTNSDVGEHNISITISDGELSVDFNTTITVVNVNDAPTLLDDTNLSSISEDVTDGSGATISSLFSSLFSDIDGDSLSGVAISVNSVDSSTVGKWQYSTDSGSTWFDIGTLSESSALLLSSDTLLRFVPVANYNGVPSGLTLYPVDSNTSLSFTSGSTRQTVDTTSDDETSSVGASSQDLNTSIISVNDEPTLSATGENLTFVENGGLTK